MKQSARNQKLLPAIKIRLICSLVLLGAALSSTFAANQYYDAGSNNGGWSSLDSVLDWSATSGSGYSVAWTNGNVGIFEGTAGTVTLDAANPPTCGGITFKSGGYTLSGGTIKVANNSAFTVGTASLSATVSSVIADSSGACNVAFGNTSARSTFTLGGANTYSGKTTLVQNTIYFDSLADGGNPSSFGQGDSTTPVVIGNNASYSQANYTGNGGSTDRPWQIGGSGGGIIQNNGYGAISFNNLSPVVVGTAGNRKLTLQGNYTATASTFAGALVDMPTFRTSLEVKGATWNILGTNSYSGVTTISGGTLQLTNDMALGSPTGAIVFSASGPLAAINLGAAERNDVTIGAARTITVNSGITANFYTPDTNNLIIAAYIKGPGNVIKKSSSYAFGTVRFSCDTNDYTGEFSAGYGHTEFTSVANTGTPSSLGKGTTGIINIPNGNASGFLTYVGDNNSATTRPLNWTGQNNYSLINNGVGTIAWLAPDALRSVNTAPASFILDGSNAGANLLAQEINDNTGATSLTKKGSGQWILTGSNTYSGGTTINGGILSVTNDAALGIAGSAITFTGSGTLAAVNLGAPVQNDVTISSDRTITVNSGINAYFGTPDTNNLVVAAYITGLGNVRKASSGYLFGTVRFTCDTNDYTGDFGVNYGNVEFTSVADQGVPSSLGTATLGTGVITLGFGNSATRLGYVGAGNSSTTRSLDWANPTTGCILEASGGGTIAYLATGNLKSGSGSGFFRLDGTNTGTNTLNQIINDNGGVTTVTKTNVGTWVLTGANNYSGDTTIQLGTLALSGSGTIGTSANLILCSGATFDVSALSGAYTLSASQSLLVTNGATATINGSLDVSSASVVMTNAINTATLNVTGGALTLGGSTPFEVDVDNGGAPLSVGSYKLISKGTGGSVAGTAPSAVTVGGDGLAGGATASLAITGGELYLNVSGGATPSTPVISGIAITGGQAILTFSGTNGTWYVLSSTNVALPIANWVTNATGAFSSLGSIVNWTNSSATAPQEFYRVKSQ